MIENGDRASAHEPPNRVFRRTTLGDLRDALFDPPTSPLEGWARTSAAVVYTLILLQLATGVLLTFYYVPTTTNAHATVAYIEKVAASGSWIRGVHYHGSVWLPVALLIHIGQLFWRDSYGRRPVGWFAAILLLALTLTAGATGYSLPWDARAFYGTRVAASITGNIPVVGYSLQAWLMAGVEITTLTLSRFFALHAFVIPAFLVATLVARFFIFRDGNNHQIDPSRFSQQVGRQAVAGSVAFVSVALVASCLPLH